MQRAQGMFGTVSACRHTLGPHHRAWMAALCGACLAVRDQAGQLSRALITTDAVAAAVLAHEVGGVEAGRRTAGPCPARGMRPASVWTGPGADVGAAVSLLAAGTALDDRVADRDVPLGRLLARPAGRWAARIVGCGVAVAGGSGLDATSIVAARARSRAVEAARPADLGAWCAPVEDAYAAAFAPAGLPGVGAVVGRVTLLADALADRESDRRRGAANPILAGACTADEAEARIETDLDAVAEVVAAARPGSLSAALWGPAWRAGVERIIAPVTGRRTCTLHPARQAGRDRAGAGLVALTGAVVAGVGVSPAMADGGRRRVRDRAKGCCDCCDCCCCCADC